MKYNEKRNNASARHPETAPSIINFAYGSNLDIHQVETRCPGAVLLGKATLNGYELAFDTAGYLSGLGAAGRKACLYHLKKTAGDPFVTHLVTQHKKGQALGA